MGPELIVALDHGDTVAALQMVDMLKGQCTFFKIGHELFTSAGTQVVERVLATGADVFLDLKFHDIPNTVRGGVRSAARLGARLVTVHASGGRSMLEAAAQGAADGGDRCGVLAVTVLTSLTPAELAANWGRDRVEMRGEALRLADMAALTGLHGVVCSGHEAAAIRDRHKGRLATLVPGIRPAGTDAQDQARVVTAEAAVEAGARYLVIGRAVTGAVDPAAAFADIASAVGR